MKDNRRKQKILVFGAGVLGSYYAALLQEGGHDVTVVARGQRYHDIKEHGIAIEYYDTKERTTTAIKVLDRMPAEGYYDFCLVLVQKNQLRQSLQELAVNDQIPAFLVMGNNAEGPQTIIEALGRERVLLGFPNAGGEREGHIVRLMPIKIKGITIGELDGMISERLKKIAGAFKDGGVKVEYSRNMDAWLRYHVAIVAPLGGAIFMAGSCNYKLARHPRIVKKWLQGVREAFRALKAHGFPVEPPVMKLIFAMPDLMLMPLVRRLLNSKLLDIAGASHARNAPEEMSYLSEELITLAREAGVKTPVLDELHCYSDPSMLPVVQDNAGMDQVEVREHSF